MKRDTANRRAVARRKARIERHGASRRAYRRAGAKLGFHIHLSAYIAVNLLLVVINFSTNSQKLWFLWPLFGWGIGLFAHWFALYVGPKLMRRLVERELEKDSQDQ
jgi:hypothetical protein